MEFDEGEGEAEAGGDLFEEGGVGGEVVGGRGEGEELFGEGFFLEGDGVAGGVAGVRLQLLGLGHGVELCGRVELYGRGVLFGRDLEHEEAQPQDQQPFHLNVLEPCIILLQPVHILLEMPQRLPRGLCPFHGLEQLQLHL